MNNTEYINELKRLGFKPKVGHYRFVRISPDYIYLEKIGEVRSSNHQKYLLSNGGETRVSLLSENNPYIRLEFLAICNKKDKYCRYTGANLALSRAYEWVLGK